VVRVQLEVPTAQICVQVPTFTGEHWSWATLDIPGCSEEYVYTPAELKRVFLAYAAVASPIVQRLSVRRFRLTAQCLITARWLGTYDLRWWSEVYRFLPEGEPLVTWYPADAWPDEVLRGAVLHAGDPAPRPKAIA
jgi:hypothetical protein